MESPQPHRAHAGSAYFPLLKILLPWLIAVALAMGHHAYNASLNGREVSSGGTKSTSLLVHSQAGASAIGTTFAFLISAFLAASAGAAFLQSAWGVARKRSFSISGLDALWSSPHNVLAFFSLDFWRTGRGVVVIAALSWAFPLVVTFAPGTLSVDTRTSLTNEVCMVTTFDLSASTVLHEEIGNALQSYRAPSALANRIVAATLFGGQPFPPIPACSGNCSYVLSVNAPSFSCTLGTLNASALTWQKQQHNTPIYAAVPFDSVPSINTYTNWDFQAHYTDYSLYLPDIDPATNDPVQGTNFTCITYNSTYHLNYTFVGSASSVVIDKIVPQQRATQLSANTTDGENGTFNTTNFSHTAWFNATSNSYALVSSLHTLILGNVTSVTTSLENANFVSTPFNSRDCLGITQTHLVSSIQSQAGNITWVSDVPRAIESLLQNITLSLLTVDPSQTTPTMCVFSRITPRFAYDARRLWLVYGLGLGCALLCDLVGVIALVRNGAGGGGGFSDFLRATRNPELNEINLGADGLRLRYGPLRKTGGRYAFAQPESLNTGEENMTLVEPKKHESVFSPESLYRDAEDSR
ncbi:hypothetical protein B0H19DRAFT_1365061 [Mycena capillaripes]|nr:hypothetical protein B0H19DRAFT_1365061 [Mycena capillaripes]